MRMRKLFTIIALILISTVSSLGAINVFAAGNYVYLGGMSAGFSVITRGANVIGLTDVLTTEGLISPAKIAGILAGDVIYNIDENEVNTAFDVEKAFNDGKRKTVVLKRDEETILKDVTPIKDVNGKYRIGVFIKDELNGIGTITYIDNNGFASLGHPITNENGSIIDVYKGEIFSCNITGYIKGERGVPGELRGVILKSDKLGEIEKNDYNGVFGVNTGIETEKLRKIEVGIPKIGNATIYATIEGFSPKEYTISIIKADNYKNSNKNLVIKITDKELLASTGGIVQGMSGSPIVQDGKIVGAVTHVFLNDPSRGFGISLSNMLNN